MPPHDEKVQRERFSTLDTMLSCDCISHLSSISDTSLNATGNSINSFYYESGAKSQHKQTAKNRERAFIKKSLNQLLLSCRSRCGKISSTSAVRNISLFHRAVHFQFEVQQECPQSCLLAVLSITEQMMKYDMQYLCWSGAVTSEHALISGRQNGYAAGVYLQPLSRPWRYEQRDGRM